MIDFFLICEELDIYFEKLLIDESRKYSLAKYQKLKNGTKVIESDHNSLVGTFNLTFQQMKTKDVKNEVFNFKDPDGQKVFKQMTSGTTLTSIFENSNVADPMKKWHKEVQNIIHRSFKKIKIKGPKPPNKEVMKAMKKKTKIIQKIEEFDAKKSPTQPMCESEYVEYFECIDSLEELNQEIANVSAEKNAEIIMEHFENLTNTDGGFSMPKMWGLRKKISPKINSEAPSAMMDAKGNLITQKAGLVKLYKNTYQERLSPKPIRAGWEDIKELKELLFKLRVEKAASIKTES